VAISDALMPERSPRHVAGVCAESVLIQAMAGWCECLQERQPLLSGLRQLAEALDARAAVLSRHSREPGGRVRSVIHNAPCVDRSGVEVARSYARCVRGRDAGGAQPASVWFSSLAEGHGDPALAVFQERTRIAETVVMVLATADKWIDYLEFHFAVPSNANARNLFGALAERLSQAWMRHSPGLFSDAILADRIQVPSRLREPILSTGNPARLSRAEFRVCVLFSHGLSTSAVCSELGISPSTLKTHLRSIFVKTETGSITELLCLLPTPSDAESASSGSAATLRA
jgi:DNA-binding CsgD family transcriptional regulator